jgi:cyclopropane-fatty-acyl-phospholipid synthase
MPEEAAGQICAPAVSGCPRPRPRSFDPWLRARVLRALRTVQDGIITIVDGDAGVTCGTPAADGLRAVVRVRHPQFYARVVTGGSLGAAESYLDGEWTTDNLVALVRIFARNLDRLSSFDGWTTQIAQFLARLGQWTRRNTRSGSRRNIAAHYDLSNEFFELFLDPTMQYSSACFASEDMSLEEASRNKLERVCRKLELTSRDHLLEIGTGWGALAEFAARQHGCRVTSTTISARQFAYATERVRQKGMQDQVTLLNNDYRDLRGQYDKLVSIEMIEAVGRSFLGEYFRVCDRLLKTGGRLLIQAIVLPEQRFDGYRRSVDFIQKYVFPGGFLPTVAAMQQAVGEQTRLRLVALDEFASSYALTLREWRHRFMARREDVRQLGFDDRFLRLWEYYLCYCEAAFRERATGVVQMEWVKV